MLTSINQYKQYKPILTDILYSSNIYRLYRLISVNISKGTLFNHGNLNRCLQYLQYYKNMSLYRLILVKHLYDRKNALQYLTDINQYIVILTDTY